MLRALSLCTCCRQYPGAATGRRLRSSRPAVSAFPEVAVGSACTSTFSELARRSLELRPAHSRRHLYVTSYTEGFSHFVTSMTAPVASGWSVRRVGLSPTGKRRLLTAHANSGHSPTAWRTGQVDPKPPIAPDPSIPGSDWAEGEYQGDRFRRAGGHLTRPWIPARSATRLREADLHILSKLGKQGLERRLEPEAFAGREVGREDDLLDVLVGCAVDIEVARQPSA